MINRYQKTEELAKIDVLYLTHGFPNIWIIVYKKYIVRNINEIDKEIVKRIKNLTGGNTVDLLKCDQMLLVITPNAWEIAQQR